MISEGQRPKKRSYRRIPGCSRIASISQRSALGSSSSYSRKKRVVLPNVGALFFSFATIHHLWPVMTSRYVPNPSESMCHQWTAPVVAARPHLISARGGRSLSADPGLPLVALHATESVENRC